ncbi:Fe-S protein assembly co-chaperone HscB [Aliamphritea hakodatensis]|uniref:Fe-S protein assembly co-chaperone HscB n=1 Tax=Aliamphritea hakodatensis TaxID=2895352 RepID=UPI0022FD3E96|nr:Fe-S protein assembly co-chaperone HscB [Aliamphritea hakodatensis]
MDIKQNYFEFLGLPESYQLDKQALSERTRELQKTLHPDKFAHLADHERRLSVQYTAYLNEAVATLKSPLSRAQYLLSLRGEDTYSESSVQLDPMFLMQQMELREAVEDIADADDPDAAVEDMYTEVAERKQVFQAEFQTLYDQADYPAAAVTVRKMQFIYKLERDVEALEDKLYD